MEFRKKVTLPSADVPYSQRALMEASGYQGSFSLLRNQARNVTAGAVIARGGAMMVSVADGNPMEYTEEKFESGGMEGNFTDATQVYFITDTAGAEMFLETSAR